MAAWRSRAQTAWRSRAFTRWAGVLFTLVRPRASVSWPDGLPAPRMQPYSVSPGVQRAETDFPFGLSRARRRTAQSNDLISAEWVFTEAQFDIFRNWFYGDLNGGARLFNFTPADRQERRGLFKGKWRAERVGRHHWIISATVQTRQ